MHILRINAFSYNIYIYNDYYMYIGLQKYVHVHQTRLSIYDSFRVELNNLFSRI